MEVVASLSQGHTAAAQCGLFTHKSVPVIFEPPCTLNNSLCYKLVPTTDVINPFSLLSSYCIYMGADKSLARPTSHVFCLMVRIFRLMLVLLYT